jgi:hypothetical protein
MVMVTLDVPRHKTLATFVALPLAFSFARTIQDDLHVHPRSGPAPQAAQLAFTAHQPIVAGATLSARCLLRATISQ